MTRFPRVSIDSYFAQVEGDPIYCPHCEKVCASNHDGHLNVKRGGQSTSYHGEGPVIIDCRCGGQFTVTI